VELAPIDLSGVDPLTAKGATSAMLARVDAAIATVDDDRRPLLDVYREHTVSELLEPDMDRVLATLVEHPHYEAYGGARVLGVPAVLDGMDEVRRFYEAIFAAPPDTRGLDVRALIVDRSALCMQGRIVIPISSLPAAPDFAPGVDRERTGFALLHACVVFPFEGTRIVGEVQYYDDQIRPDGVVYVD
jgi:hypothetical protein